MTCVPAYTIHSFIHYGDLYSAPSRLLLRSAPDPCTAKKKSFETRVECVRKNPGKQSLRQRKPIPHRGTNHRECTGLGCGGEKTRLQTSTRSSDYTPPPLQLSAFEATSPLYGCPLGKGCRVVGSIRDVGAGNPGSLPVPNANSGIPLKVD